MRTHLLLLSTLLLALASCTSTEKSAPQNSPAAPPAETITAPRTESAFRFISYVPETRILSIQFNDGTRTNYTGVPQATYMALLTAPSKHTFFTNAIQPHHPALPDP